jgi:hypothetical protein
MTSFELLETPQSSQTDEDETSSESFTGLLPLSSPQATSTAATKPIVKNFFKAIKFTPTKPDKYTQFQLPSPHFRRFKPKISIFRPP